MHREIINAYHKNTNYKFIFQMKEGEKKKRERKKEENRANTQIRLKGWDNNKIISNKKTNQILPALK